MGVLITIVLDILKALPALKWLVGLFQHSAIKDMEKANEVENKIASLSDKSVDDELQQWTRK